MTRAAFFRMRGWAGAARSRRNRMALIPFWPSAVTAHGDWPSRTRLFRCCSYSSLQHLLRVGAKTRMTEHHDVNCSRC